MRRKSDFEGMSKPVDGASESHSSSEKDPIHKNKFKVSPMGVGYNITYAPFYKNSKLDQFHGCNETFGKDCVDWFVNERLEMKTLTKQFFETRNKMGLYAKKEKKTFNM